MILVGEELKDFLKDFQNELIEKDVPLFGENSNLEDDNDFSEYEFVFEKDKIKLFELDSDYTIIESVEIFESFNPVSQSFATELLYTTTDGLTGHLFANIYGTDAYKRTMHENNVKVIAECECGFRSKEFDSIKETVDFYPSDTCPNCGTESLNIVYSDYYDCDKCSEDETNEFISDISDFNSLSLSDKVKIINESSKCILNEGSTITLNAEGIPTITFDAFEETYDIKDIYYKDATYTVEYDAGFEVDLRLIN